MQKRRIAGGVIGLLAIVGAGWIGTSGDTGSDAEEPTIVTSTPHQSAADDAAPTRPTPTVAAGDADTNTVARAALPMLPTATSPAPLRRGDAWRLRKTVPGEVLVGLSRSADLPALTDVIDRWGYSVVRASDVVPAVRLSVPDGELVAAAQRLRRLPFVREVRPHGVTRGSGLLGSFLGGLFGGGSSETVDTDTTTAVCEWHGAWTYTANGSKGARMKVRSASCDADCTSCKVKGSPSRPSYSGLQWHLGCSGFGSFGAKGATGRGITVAVLDTGVAYENRWADGTMYALAPDLDHVWFQAPYDFVNDDSHANDDNGHGTQMTTLIAGFGGAFGFAPNVSIMPVKVLDADKVGTELELVEGIHWAVDNGADVINLSLTLPVDYPPSALLDEAVAYALSRGIVVVAATGNDGAEQVPWPAAFPGVVAVGASALDDVSSCSGSHLADYTNRSSRLDVALPSGTHGRDTDGDGYPDAAVSMTFAPGAPYYFDYWFNSGTSPAAAMASGVIALMLERGADPEDIPALMQSLSSAEGATVDHGNPNAPGLRVSKSVLDGSRLTARVTNPGAACGSRAHYSASPVGVLERDGDDLRARFAVEVIDEDLAPVSDALVVAQLSVGAAGSLSGVTDDDGVVTFVSDPLVTYEGGVAVSMRVESVSVPGCPGRLARPGVFARVEEATWILFENLHVGGSASDLVLLIDEAAAATLDGADPATQVPTYMSRSLGGSMASTPFVLLMDDAFLDATDQRASSAIFRTFGTGMAVTSLEVDRAFFDPTYVNTIDRKQVMTFGRVGGTGMAVTSRIAKDGAWLAEDTYTSRLQYDPAALVMKSGGDSESTVAVYDRAVLSPALEEGAVAPDAVAQAAAVGGTGMAVTSRVGTYALVYEPSVYDSQQTMYYRSVSTTGAGQDSSALVDRQPSGGLLGALFDLVEMLLSPLTNGAGWSCVSDY